MSGEGRRAGRLLLAASLALALGAAPVRAWADDARAADDGAVAGEAVAGAQEDEASAQESATPLSPDADAAAETDVAGEGNPEWQEQAAPAAAEEPAAEPAEPQQELAEASVDNIASGTWGTCLWVISADGTLTVHPGVGADTNGESPWASIRSNLPDGSRIAKVRFVAEGTKKVIAPKDCSALLRLPGGSGNGNPSILDISGLDTSQVTNMSEMLAGWCGKTLDLSGLNTSNVTDMSSMFSNCVELTSVNLSGWDTSKVTSMQGMFEMCMALKTLDLSGWDTSKVNTLRDMFQWCKALKTLDLSGWDTSSVTDMGFVFHDCESLTALDLAGWDTRKVTNMAGMFANCLTLAALDTSGWSTSHVENMSHLFAGCSSLKALDLSGWDVSHVTNMVSMFGCGTDNADERFRHYCTSLKSLNLSGWDVSSVEYAWAMFEGCSSLTSLDVADWNTKNVTEMSSMFKNCSSLKSLDLSRWNTQNTKLMIRLFQGCSALEKLDLSGWDTSGTVLRYEWTDENGSVQGQDYDPFDLMFDGCSSLAELRIGAKYDMKTAGAFPAATAKSGKWWSEKDRAWYSKDDIVSKRNKVADTYHNAESLQDISKATLSDIGQQTYTGKPLTPSVTVKLGGRTLKAGTDYELSYEHNVDAGIGTAIVTGRGNYTGTVRAKFRIVGIAISADCVDAIADQAYTGQPVEPPVTVRCGGRTLKAGTDFSYYYEDNVEVGTATVHVNVWGNYRGSVAKAFRIVPATRGWQRLAGGQRYQTMAAIVGEGWKGTGGVVVVARGDDFKDALAASALAGLDGAPIVLTKSLELRPEARAQLVRLKPSRVYVAGGPVAVSDAVLRQIASACGLKAGTTVKRLAGSNSVLTSVELARAGKGRWQGGTAIVATNGGFRDALSVAPVAYAKGWPVLLSSPARGLLPEVTSAMRELGVKRVYIVGGTAAVPAKVESQLKSAGIAVAGRLWGANGIETSARIADWALTQGLSADNMGFATSVDFPDALAGAALCGKRGGVLLLAYDRNATTEQNLKFATNHAGEIRTGYVFGGSAAFSDRLFGKLPK